MEGFESLVCHTYPDLRIFLSRMVAKNAFSCGREVLRAGGVKRGEGRRLPGGGHEKGPIPAAVREGRGLSGASPGCADVACRCLGVKGGERIASPRSEASALHRSTSGVGCVVPPGSGAVSVPGRRGRSFRFLRLHIQGTLTGSACRRIGIIFPVVLRGSGYCAVPAAGSVGAASLA